MPTALRDKAEQIILRWRSSPHADSPAAARNPAHLPRPGIVLYSKGSVEFNPTYPGMRVPQPIGIRPALRTRSARDTGGEILALTKMNWNQTWLDGRYPAKLRTANLSRSKIGFGG